MKANVIKNIALIAIIIAIVASVLAIPVYAGTTTLFDAGSISTYANTTNDGGGASSSVRTIVQQVLSGMKIVCMGIAITMLLVLAMKYMSAAPSEKADIKKHAVVYVVGAVVMFAATGILHIIGQFAGSI